MYLSLITLVQADSRASREDGDNRASREDGDNRSLFPVLRLKTIKRGTA
jgi:hypothetical protein